METNRVGVPQQTKESFPNQILHIVSSSLKFRKTGKVTLSATQHRLNLLDTVYATSTKTLRSDSYKDDRKPGLPMIQEAWLSFSCYAAH